jgi:hypothetical protein
VHEARRADRARGSTHSRSYHGPRGQEVRRDDSARRMSHSRSPYRMQETRREDRERGSAHSRSFQGVRGQEARRDDSALYKIHTRRDDRERGSTHSNSIHGARGQEARREHGIAHSRSFHCEHEARAKNREGATARSHSKHSDQVAPSHSDHRTTKSRRAMSPWEEQQEQHLLVNILNSHLYSDFR